MHEIPLEPQNVGKAILLIIVLIIAMPSAMIWGGIKLMTASRQVPPHHSAAFCVGVCLLLCGLTLVGKIATGLLTISSKLADVVLLP